jgi:UDP-N-acetyl-D-galactosamine dehydrogenase
LAQKAQELGYHPEIILAGRRLNDEMGKYVANEVIKLMLKKDIKVKNSKVLVLGFTFKEDCPDVRNTKVIDIVNELKSYDVNVTIYDPLANPEEVMHEYSVASQKDKPEEKYDAIILAVAHHEFKKLKLEEYSNSNCIIYDVKNVLSKNITDARL